MSDPLAQWMAPAPEPPPALPRPTDTGDPLAGWMTSTPQDSKDFIDNHIATSPEPTAEKFKIDAAQQLSTTLGLPPGFTYENLDLVSQQTYGEKVSPPNILQRLGNTVKATELNRQINRLSARQWVGLDSPELAAQIKELQAQLPTPDEQIKGIPGSIVSQLYSLGWSFQRDVSIGALADPQATTIQKATATIATILAGTPGFGLFILGGRLLKDMNEQSAGAFYRASIDAGMDPTVARVGAGVTALVGDALNTLQISAATTAAQRLGTTVVMKNLLSGAVIKLGLAATEQEAIAYGFTLADKLVNEAAVSASNQMAGTNLPHKEFTRILAEAGIESIPMAVVGTVIAGAGIGGEAYRIRKGSQLETQVRDAVQKAVDAGQESAPVEPPRTEMTVEQKQAIWQSRVDEAKAAVADITARLETAKPAERAVLEADLADYQRVASTAFDVNLQWFGNNPGDMNVGDVMRAGEGAEPDRIIHVEEARQAKDFNDFKAMQNAPRTPDEKVMPDTYWKSVWDEAHGTAEATGKKTFTEMWNQSGKENAAIRAETVAGRSRIADSAEFQKTAVPELRREAAAKAGAQSATRTDRAGGAGASLDEFQKTAVPKLQREAVRAAFEKAKVQREARQSVNKMIRNIAGVDPVGLRDPYRANVQAIKDVFVEVRHTQKTLDRLTAIKKGLEANPDAEISQYDLGRLDDLGKTPLRNLSVDELRTVHDAVMMYAKLSREEHTIKVGEVRMAADKAVAGSLAEVPSADKLAKRMVSSNPSLGEVTGEVKQWIKDRFGVDLLNFDLLAELMGPTAYKTLFQNVHDGHVAAIKYEQDRIADFAKDTRPLHEKYHDMSNWLNERSAVGQVTTRDGTVLPLELSRGERMSLYMHAKNRQNVKHLLDGGFGFRWRKGERDTVYRIDAENLKKITDSVRGNADEALYAKAADNLLRRTGQDLDSKFYDLNDVHLDIVNDYYQISTMPTARGKAAENEMQFDLAKSNWARIGLFKNMTKGRVDSKIPIYLDPIAYSLNRSLEHASAYIGLEEPLRNASRLLYYNREGKNYRQEISARLGERWWADLEKGLKDIAGMRDTYGVLEGAAMKWRNNIAVATLGLNVGSMLKQTLGMLNYLAFVKPQYLMEGVVDAILHPIGVDKTHRIYSPEYVQRAAKGYSRETADVLKGGGYGSAFGGQEQIKTRLMAGIQYFDRFTVKRGMQGAVRQVLAEMRDGALSPTVSKALGIGDAQIPIDSAERMKLAYKYADYATERSQNMGLPEFQSTMIRGNAFEKLLTLFSSENSASMNLRRRAYFEAKKTGSAKAWKRFAEVAFVTVVLNSLGSMLIDRARTGARGGKIYPIEKDAAYGLVSQMVSGLPGVRDIANLVLRHAILGAQAQSNSILPFQRTIDTAIATFNSAVDATNAQSASRRNKALLKVADSAAETIGLMAGIPYVPVRSVVQMVIRAVKALTQ